LQIVHGIFCEETDAAKAPLLRTSIASVAEVSSQMALHILHCELPLFAQIGMPQEAFPQTLSVTMMCGGQTKKMQQNHHLGHK